MSDYEGLDAKVSPPGKRARKPRAKKERKDNIHVLPDGYVETTINGMTVLVKKPVETKVIESKPITAPPPAATAASVPVKKPRKKSAWCMAVGEFGMPKKNTEEYKDSKKNTKVCKLCDIEKPLDQYYSYTYINKSKGEHIRHNVRCIPCYKEIERKKYVKREKKNGIYALSKEERKQLYDLIKSGKPLAELRKEYAHFKKLNYGTIYVAVKPDRIENLLC